MQKNRLMFTIAALLFGCACSAPKDPGKLTGTRDRIAPLKQF